MSVLDKLLDAVKLNDDYDEDDYLDDDLLDDCLLYTSDAADEYLFV